MKQKKLSIVKIDKTLDKHKNKVLFQEKVDKANEALKNIGLPKVAQKSKA